MRCARPDSKFGRAAARPTLRRQPVLYHRGLVMCEARLKARKPHSLSGSGAQSSGRKLEAGCSLEFGFGNVFRAVHLCSSTVKTVFISSSPCHNIDALTPAAFVIRPNSLTSPSQDSPRVPPLTRPSDVKLKPACHPMSFRSHTLLSPLFPCLALPRFVSASSGSTPPRLVEPRYRLVHGRLCASTRRPYVAPAQPLG